MSKLQDFQKSLRINQTDAKSCLWRYLRNRRFLGFKFRRQHILFGYIVDFVCLEKKLIIELDGGQHANAKDYDTDRTTKLANEGFQVVRFWNNDVLQNIDGVLESLQIFVPLTRRSAPTSPTRGEVKQQCEFSPNTRTLLRG